MSATVKIPFEAIKAMRSDPLSGEMTLEVENDYTILFGSSIMLRSDVEKNYISKESLAGYLEARAEKLRISAGNHGAKGRYKMAQDDAADAAHLEGLASSLRAFGRLPLGL